jgi:hypothetical protein
MRQSFSAGALLVAVIFGCGRQSISDERERIDALIELLASKNAAPTKDGPLSGIEPPLGYDKGHQGIVFRAIQQLLKEGDTAFDALIDHSADKRYSISYEAPSGPYHLTVGSICSRVISRSVYCYEDLGKLQRISSDQRGHPEMANAAEWWEKNRKKSLWQIQVEMIDRQIVYFQELDLATSRPPHRYVTKPPIATLEELRSQNISALKTMRARIVATKQAYRPRSIDEPYGRLTWLPWETVSFGK